MAIHATDLLYDIALSHPLALPRSLAHSLCPPYFWHSLLYPFAPLSLLSWLPVYFFPCVIAGARKCTLSSALWRLRWRDR